VTATPPPDARDSQPNRGTLGQPPMGGGQQVYLSVQRLDERGDGPSWKAPKPPHGPRARWSTQRIVTMVVLLAVLALVSYLKIAGVV
jgi:hypothetical protein